MEENIESKHWIKAEYEHPVYTCVYRIAFQFFITYLGFAHKVSDKKLQRNAENACGNLMCKRALRQNFFTSCSIHKYFFKFYLSIMSKIIQQIFWNFFRGSKKLGWSTKKEFQFTKYKDQWFNLLYMEYDIWWTNKKQPTEPLTSLVKGFSTISAQVNFRGPWEKA